MKAALLSLSVLFTMNLSSSGQSFYFGADQSYVNEMEDCGVQYKENGEVKDVHKIFADHGCNLVRLRLWHTPNWYDQLNEGRRYSDLTDVIKSVRRVKQEGMKVLLNFHLSDNWADPSKQIIPRAWLPLVDNLPLLLDSLYGYITNTLEALHQSASLPDMVQIGNETNRGILLSPKQNEVWTLDWNRNAPLFNRAIDAVRDIEIKFGQEIKIILHVAGPKEVVWWIDQFVSHGVDDFDIIGMSYYWAWHKPTTIVETGQVISTLKSQYPDKEVLVVETGYLWTEENFDRANNIINEANPDYLPVSPQTQKRWLVDLSESVMAAGGSGVVYWEPCWVANNCWNQWDQGSHQDHATFFDQNHNLLKSGGIGWMEYPYATSISTLDHRNKVTIKTQDNSLEIFLSGYAPSANFSLQVIDTTGRIIHHENILSSHQLIKLPGVQGPLFVSIYQHTNLYFTKKILMIR